MREIKFRGKPISDNHRKRFGEWVYGDLTQVYPNDYPPEITHLVTDWYSTVPVILETVGQYTGLKDKNGKEIYEGDIIEIYQYIYETFSEGSLEGNDFYAWQEPVDSLGVQGVVIFKKGKFAVDEWILNWFAEDETEVIGNIYENPELLEV